MKKDTNYIAAVEKAIAEKYGKNTVQDFRSTWSEDKEKRYLEELKKRNKTNRKENKRTKREACTDRTCPICKTYSFSAIDDLYMNRFKCCFLCYSDFVVMNEEEWENGWRPSGDYLFKILRGRNNGNSSRNS